jgi:hypothetical protein
MNIGDVRAMDKGLDKAIFSAALEVINRMWGDTMDSMQQASLANQIVREIEARSILE